MSGLKRRFPDLPTWVFFMDEVSAGVFIVRAVDQSGRTVEVTGLDPEALIMECRRFAKSVEADEDSR